VVPFHRHYGDTLCRGYSLLPGIDETVVGVGSLRITAAVKLSTEGTPLYLKLMKRWWGWGHFASPLR
jgi:hypothetical protein